MDIINIRRGPFAGEAFKLASPSQRGTWFTMLLFCCGLENSGFIAGAATFTDRVWFTLVGVRLRDVKDKCDLWHHENGGIRVALYPLEDEIKCQENRENGRRGGLAKAAKEKMARMQAGDYSTPASSTLSATATSPAASPATSPATSLATTKGNGKETATEGREASTLAHIPDEREFIDAFMALGIPVSYLKERFLYLKGRNDWINRNGEMMDFVSRVHGWWLQDRAEWRGSESEKKLPAAQALEQLLAAQGVGEVSL